MVLDALLALLRRQTIPVTLFILIVSPVFTYYISTKLFYHGVNSKSTGKKPPTIPYWIPGLYHWPGLATSPSKYFGHLIKQYGNYAPFTVKAGPLSFLVLRDPNHIGRVFRAENVLTPKAFHIRYYKKVIGAPKNVLDLYRGLGTTAEEKEVIDYSYQSLPQKHLTGAPLIPIAEVYTFTLSRNLHDKMFQFGTWTQIEDLWSFVQLVITPSLIETLFGSTLLKQYPKIVQDYWEFDDHIESFTWGVPRFIIPSGYAVRDRLYENITKWLKTYHSGSESSRLEDEDPAWDANMGTKFIQERDDVFAKIGTLDYHARTAEMLGVLQGSISSLVPSIFWALTEVLRRPILNKHLIAEITQYCAPHTTAYDLLPITNLPIIQSIHSEIERLRIATYAIRTNEVDGFQIDENWAIPKDISVIMFSHDISMNTDVWSKVRPQLVERPLNEFWAERFLVPDKSEAKEIKEKNKDKTDKIGTGRFSMEGLDSLHFNFKKGHHACMGQSFAKAVQAGTLAILLNEFEIEICDQDAVSAAMPSVRENAYGIVKPLDKVSVRIRKRKIGDRSKKS